MTPTLIQNESKIYRNCPPGAPWGALGAFQSPWSPPGALQEPFGTLRGPILDPPGAILESPGDHFRPPGVNFGLILDLRDHLEAFGEPLKTLGTILHPWGTFCSVQAPKSKDMRCGLVQARQCQGWGSRPGNLPPRAQGPEI